MKRLMAKQGKVFVLVSDGTVLGREIYLAKSLTVDDVKEIDEPPVEELTGDNE
jgi:hypothetical protein